MTMFAGRTAAKDVAAPAWPSFTTGRGTAGAAGPFRRPQPTSASAISARATTNRIRPDPCPKTRGMLRSQLHPASRRPPAHEPHHMSSPKVGRDLRGGGGSSGA